MSVISSRFVNTARVWIARCWPLFFLVLFASCDLFDDEQEEQTNIRFISYINGGPNLNAQISGSTIEVVSYIPSPTPADPTTVPRLTAVEAGIKRYQVTRTTSDSPVVLRGTLTLQADTFYTGYLTGEVDDASLTLVGEEPIAQPPDGVAIVRIVHAYPRIGAVEAAIHDVQQSPGGGLEEGARIALIQSLTRGETSDLVEIDEPQIAVLASTAARQLPILLLSPVEGRLYTIVITQPGGPFGNADFGMGVYHEDL